MVAGVYHLIMVSERDLRVTTSLPTLSNGQTCGSILPPERTCVLRGIYNFISIGQLSARQVVPTTAEGQSHGKENIFPHMNRSYELGFIIPSSVQESETKSVIEVVKNWITDLGGEVTNVDYWGRRRLAYPIEDFREGYYVFFRMDYPTESLSELERNLKLSDQVIRHLVVRLDE